MKHIYLIIILNACFTSNTFGQKGGLFIAYYQSSSITNLQQPDKKSIVLWTLQIDSTGYSFFDPVKRESDSLYALDLGAGMDAMQVLANSARYRRGAGFHAYASIDSNKIKVYENLGVYYNYEETLPLQKWHLLPDTTTILGQVVHKASTLFRGRTYYAWYCPSIPLSAGPWKFSGLPGLILRIGDEQGHYQYECVGMETVNAIRAKSLVLDSRSTSFADFSKLRQLRAENPAAYLRVMAPGISITPNNESAKRKLEQSGNVKARFNPIELMDK